MEGEKEKSDEQQQQQQDEEGGDDKAEKEPEESGEEDKKKKAAGGGFLDSLRSLKSTVFGGSKKAADVTDGDKVSHSKAYLKNTILTL